MPDAGAPRASSSPAKWLRYAVTGVFLAAAFILLHSVSHGEPVVQHQPLAQIPSSVGNWKGTDVPLAKEILQATNVTDYANRLYLSDGHPPIQLYVGYYGSQKTGDTIHSPKNCLPGSGWDPVRSGFVRVPIDGRPDIVVNEYLVQRDAQKQLVFYWYQGRGRVLASEYAGKFWMIADAVSRNRTDGALVRLVTPITGDESAARAFLTQFAQEIFPSLDNTLPK
jgi:EpsI family protein